jgi:putative flippase GtrA
MPDSSPAASGTDDETEAERNNRNLNDLLQELRVAGLGVQMLFGFLLALPFTVRFVELDGHQRALYKTSVLFAALSTALLIAPVAYHRWVFRRHEKSRLLKFANVVAIMGLGCVAVAISCAVWLILTFVGESPLVSAFAGAVTASFVALWFVLPIFERVTRRTRR